MTEASSTGLFIAKGDKTSCGGEVLEGDGSVTVFGLAHAYMGGAVTCGKNGQTYRILGGVSHRDSPGKLLAGTLDSFSNCPCRASLIASSTSATYTSRRTESPALEKMPSGRPPFRPSPFPPSSRLVPALADRHGPHEPGFYVVPKSMSRQALEATLFPQPDPGVMYKFRALNPGLGELKAGQMIVLGDPRNRSCTYQEAQMMQAAREVKATLDEHTPEEAEFLYRHGVEIASFTGQVSTWLGVTTVISEKHLSNLRETLQDMERLHQDTFRQHGKLKTPHFFAERKRLLTKLDAHLLNSPSLRGKTTFGDHPKLKTALGISSKSLVHQWHKAGAPGEIPGYAAHVKAISRAAKYMQTGGYLAIGVGFVSSVVAIHQVCEGDTGEACKKVRFTETGKWAGATGLGYAGGVVGKYAAGSVCIALGVSTGIGGVVCTVAVVGTAAWVGTKLGEESGEFIGDTLYEVTRP